MHGPSVHYLNDVFLKYSLFLVVLGLCCCMSAFSSCREQRLFSSCSAWASVGHVGSIVMAHRHSCPSFSMWRLLGLGIELVSPALQGKLLTIGPPGQPPGGLLKSLETLSLLPGIPLVCISPKWPTFPSPDDSSHPNSDSEVHPLL